MKVILLLISLVFALMALGSCTNEEGEDLDVLTPTEKDENSLLPEYQKIKQD